MPRHTPGASSGDPPHRTVVGRPTDAPVARRPSAAGLGHRLGTRGSPRDAGSPLDHTHGLAPALFRAWRVASALLSTTPKPTRNSDFHITATARRFDMFTDFLDSVSPSRPRPRRHADASLLLSLHSTTRGAFMFDESGSALRPQQNVRTLWRCKATVRNVSAIGSSSDGRDRLAPGVPSIGPPTRGQLERRRPGGPSGDADQRRAVSTSTARRARHAPTPPTRQVVAKQQRRERRYPCCLRQ
jgi:hypothetical protein